MMQICKIKNSTTGADASGEFQLAACIQFIHALATQVIRAVMQTEAKRVLINQLGCDCNMQHKSEIAIGFATAIFCTRHAIL